MCSAKTHLVGLEVKLKKKKKLLSDKATKEETTILIEVKSSKAIDEYKNSIAFKEVTKALSYYMSMALMTAKPKSKSSFQNLILEKLFFQEKEKKRKKKEGILPRKLRSMRNLLKEEP